MPLAGRVALVTGGNHGIGAATCVALAGLGADVAVSFLRLAQAELPGTPAEYAERRRRNAGSVVSAVEALQRRCLSVESDLSDPGAPKALFDRVEAELGPIAILVNNASRWRQDSFLSGSPDPFGRLPEPVSASSFDSQFMVDARAGALLISELSRRHRERGDSWGRIVSLSSGGPQGFPTEVSYGAAKAALENLTMSAATELGPLGITANVVHPPVTDTGWVTEAVREDVARNRGVVAAPEQVAEVIAWLCTDSARLVSGNILRLR